jgi:hypothetical protein
VEEDATHPFDAHDLLERDDEVVLVLVELGVVAQVVGGDEELAPLPVLVSAAIACTEGSDECLRFCWLTPKQHH